jgi:hypothetical protein
MQFAHDAFVDTMPSPDTMDYLVHELFRMIDEDKNVDELKKT